MPKGPWSEQLSATSLPILPVTFDLSWTLKGSESKTSDWPYHLPEQFWSSVLSLKYWVINTCLYNSFTEWQIPEAQALGWLIFQSPVSSAGYWLSVAYTWGGKGRWMVDGRVFKKLVDSMILLPVWSTYYLIWWLWGSYHGTKRHMLQS